MLLLMRWGGDGWKSRKWHEEEKEREINEGRRRAEVEKEVEEGIGE